MATVLSTEQHHKNLPVLSLAMTQCDETLFSIQVIHKAVATKMLHLKKVILLRKYGIETCLILQQLRCR